MERVRTVMVATVGGQPQVVTFALDALLAQGVSVEEIYLLHLSPRNPRVAASLKRLLAEFEAGIYRAANHPCRVHRVPLKDGVNVLEDIRNQRESQAVLGSVQQLLMELKRQGHAVHLCVAGGRRVVALLAVSAAALLCDHRDRVWHIYTPDAIRAQAEEGAIMHVPPEAGVRLVPVPLVPWGEYFPALRSLALGGEETLARHLRRLSAEEERRCQTVWARLTPRQQDVLRAFARGLRPQEVAQTLGVSLNTVNSHKTAILAECRNAWDMEEGSWLDYRFLREQFAPFFRHRPLQGELDSG